MPVGARFVHALTHSGLMLPVPDPELAAVAAAEFFQVPIDRHAHLAIITSRHARVWPSDLDVPVAFVAGSYDVLAGARDMASAAARNDDATYVELRASHVAMEQPDRLHRLLLGFLDRVG